MKIQNAKVTITFDEPNEILDAMEDDEQEEFLESLSCQEAVIEYVMDQVFEGYTRDNLYHGNLSFSWNGNTALQQFKNRLIEVGADYAAKKRIEELEKYCENMDAEIKSLLDRFNKGKEVFLV